MANEDWGRWRQARLAELSGPDSWLGLVGLFWLEAPLTRVGSVDDCPVRLPSGPAHLGDLRLDDDVVWWLPAAGAPCALQTDRQGVPTTVDHENLAFFVVDRDGRRAVRVRDRDWARQRPFAGIECFEHDPDWVIQADWQPLETPLTLEVPNVSGELKPVTVQHQASFTRAGESVRLLPMSVTEEGGFFVFRDRTSGRDTYGAGRFLKTAPPAEGRIVLDFNRAFNPPCAFTPFATCPLPPPENWLPFAVTAGERYRPMLKQ